MDETIQFNAEFVDIIKTKVKKPIITYNINDNKLNQLIYSIFQINRSHSSIF
jgi:hypothetical protein